MSDTSDFYAANKQALKSALSSGFVTDGEGNIVTGSQGAPVTTEVDKEAEVREQQLNQARHILAALASKYPEDSSLRDALGAVESNISSRNFTALAVSQAFRQVASEQKTTEQEAETETTKAARTDTVEKISRAARSAVESIVPAATLAEAVAEDSPYSLTSSKPFDFKKLDDFPIRAKFGVPENDYDDPFMATNLPKKPRLGTTTDSFWAINGEIPKIGMDGKIKSDLKLPGMSVVDDNPYSLANPKVHLPQQDKDLRRKMRDMREELRSKGIDIDTPSSHTSPSVSGGQNVSASENVSPTLVHNNAVMSKKEVSGLRSVGGYF